MTVNVLPKNFRTLVQPTGVLEVKTPTGELLMTQDLLKLATNLLNGEATNRAEQSAAGAAIVHLLSLS